MGIPSQRPSGVSSISPPPHPRCASPPYIKLVIISPNIFFHLHNNLSAATGLACIAKSEGMSGSRGCKNKTQSRNSISVQHDVQAGLWTANVCFRVPTCTKGNRANDQTRNTLNPLNCSKSKDPVLDSQAGSLGSHTLSKNRSVAMFLLTGPLKNMTTAQLGRFCCRFWWCPGPVFWVLGCSRNSDCLTRMALLKAPRQLGLALLSLAWCPVVWS